MLPPRTWADLRAFLLTERDLATSTTADVLRKLHHQERQGLALDRGPRRRAWRSFVARKKSEGCGPAGVRHHVVALRHFLAYRGRSWPELRLPREPHPVRALLPDDVLQRVLEYDVGDDPLVAGTARAIFNATFAWVLRPPSEPYALQLDDLDVEHRRLRVWMDKLDVHDVQQLRAWEANVARPYLEEVRPRVLRATRSYRRGPESSAFFLDPRTGTAFASRAAMGIFLRRCIKRVHHDAIPYDLRIAGASWVWAQTHDLEACRRKLRHSSTRSTEWYLRAIRALESERAHDLRPFDGTMLASLGGAAIAPA